MPSSTRQEVLSVDLNQRRAASFDALQDKNEDALVGKYTQNNIGTLASPGHCISPYSTDSNSSSNTTVASTGANTRHATTIEVFTVLWDAALTQPLRGFSEFFRGATLPTQEVCTLRLLVNFVYFTRNYLNMALFILIPICVWDPYLLLFSGLSSIVRRVKTGRPRFPAMEVGKASSDAVESPGGKQPELQKSHAAPSKEVGRRSTMFENMIYVIQLLLCIGAVYTCGIFSIIRTTFFVFFPIVTHACFIPYSDDAYRLYERIVRLEGLSARVPSSPITSFQQVHPTFAYALRRFSDADTGMPGVLPPSSTSPKSNVPSPS